MDTRSEQVKKVTRNAITDHTLDADMPMIEDLAKEFASLTDMEKYTLSMYVLENQSLDFYYGMFVAMSQLFAVVMVAEDDASDGMSASIKAIMCAVAEKILTLMQI